MRPRRYFEAIATFTGCVIGAGILGIPYVVAQAGFWTGMVVLAVIGVVALVVHLLEGEVTLRTRRIHQAVGYAGKYVGPVGKWLMVASMMIGVYGALIAYTLGVSQSLVSIFGGHQWLWIVVFYGGMTALLLGGLRVLGRSELLFEGMKAFFFLAILFVLFGSFSPESIDGFSWKNVFIPYGVIMFASIGFPAIPEVREELARHKKLMKEVIVVGTLIPLVTYVLFTVGVLGVTGQATTEVATIGLAEALDGAGFVLLHAFAILAMVSSFMALGYALKEMYHYDFGLSREEAWGLTMVVPIVLVLIGAQSFVSTLNAAGAFAGGMAGILVVLAHRNARKSSERKPEYKVKINWVGYSALIALFVLGIAYQLFLL